MASLERQCYKFLLDRMYSFHFETKNLRFQEKAFKEISFLTEITSIHPMSGAIQHGRRAQNMTCFRFQFYLGFVLRRTIQFYMHINGPYL